MTPFGNINMDKDANFTNELGFASVSTYVVSGLMIAAQGDAARRAGTVADYSLVKNAENQIIGQVRAFARAHFCFAILCLDVCTCIHVVSTGPACFDVEKHAQVKHECVR